MLELGMHNLQTHSLCVSFPVKLLNRDAAHSSQTNKVITGGGGILLERLRLTPRRAAAHATVQLVS